MKGDDNEQGSLLGQAITQVCCNEHPPTGVLIPWQVHAHTDTHTQHTPTHPHTHTHKSYLAYNSAHPYASICVLHY